MDETVDAARKTVLLADSDEFFTVAYKDGIEQAGFEVIVAHDGQQTLEILKTERPDAILIELILPKVNGFEVLEYMKKNKQLRKIPVLVVTTLSQASDEEEARSYGANDFLLKSEISVDDVVFRLENLFAEE